MANHKSAEKRARQSVRRNARNNQRKSAVKTLEKQLEKGIQAKAKEVPELLRSYTSEMMKAARKGIFKAQTASRKIGRLSARVSSLLK